MSSPIVAQSDLTVPHAGPDTSAVEWGYRISLAAKGLLGAMQATGGIGLWLAPGGSVKRFIDWMTRHEIAQDPTDPLARMLTGWAAQLTAGTESFYAVYLVGHGALNLAVVLALIFRIPGAYHVSLAVLWGFVAYQLWHFMAAPDLALLVLTAIDLAVIALVIAERRRGTRAPTAPRHTGDT